MPLPEFRLVNTHGEPTPVTSSPVHSSELKARGKLLAVTELREVRYWLTHLWRSLLLSQQVSFLPWNEVCCLGFPHGATACPVDVP